MVMVEVEPSGQRAAPTTHASRLAIHVAQDGICAALLSRDLKILVPRVVLTFDSGRKRGTSKMIRKFAKLANGRQRDLMKAAQYNVQL